MKRLNGKVKWFKPNIGYGFIETDDGKDYFLHYSKLAPGTKEKFLKEGTNVSFDPEESEKGAMATNVKIIK